MKAEWKTVPLGEMLEVQSGYAFKSKQFSEIEGMPLIRIRDLKAGKGTVVNFVGDYDAQYVVENGDLLIGMDGEFRCYDWQGGRALLNQRVCKLKNFAGCLEPRFLYFGINKYLKEIEDVTAFTTVKHLSAKSIKSINFPIPPLEEQRRIVAVLDEAFEGLARAKENAEVNLQNARELSDALVEVVFDKLPSSTPVNELETHCTDRGITYGVIKLGNHDPNGVPCLRTSNVRPLQIDVEGMKLIAPKLSEEYRRTVLQGGEVLVNVRGTLGGVATVPDEMIGWNISREVAMVPVDQRRLNSDFAAFFISTRKAQAWLTGVVKGAAYKGINLRDLRLLKIPLPALDVQMRVVEEITNIRKNAKAVEEAYSRKLHDLDDLRQSLLQKTFAGELI